jgi:hypothetical protein
MQPGGFSQPSQTETRHVNGTKSYTVIVREGVDHLIAGLPEKGELTITLRGNSNATIRSVTQILKNQAALRRTTHIVVEDDGNGGALSRCAEVYGAAASGAGGRSTQG